MPQTAARQMAEAYLAGRARTQQSFQYMEPVLDRSLLLVIGSHSIGMARPGSDLDLELIVPDQEYPSLLAAAGGVRGLWIHDEAHQPLTDIKVRPQAWLRERLSGEDPVALWVYQRAVVVRGPADEFGRLLAAGLDRFRAEVAPGLVRRHYRDLRSGVTTGEVRDDLARQIMLGKVLEAALVLPLLAAGEPYPYPKWQAWWLGTSHPLGAEIVRLCGTVGEEATFGALRRLIEGMLIDAGYGESLVRDFWRKL
jgi:hypothetical protein